MGRGPQKRPTFECAVAPAQVVRTFVERETRHLEVTQDEADRPPNSQKLAEKKNNPTKDTRKRKPSRRLRGAEDGRELLKREGGAAPWPTSL